MQRIILASASPRRSDLLKQIGLVFEVIPSNTSEKVNACLNVEDVVKELSLKKAMSIAINVDENSIVIGADTIVVKDKILGKPSNDQEALEMLKSLQGQWHKVITGVSIVETKTLRYISSYETTLVKMKQLSEKTLTAYIKTGEPSDKAGSYGIQGKGALLIERIDGCYSNVVGLPLSKISTMFGEFGVDILS